jgi:hypothetical protein
MGRIQYHVGNHAGAVHRLHQRTIKALLKFLHKTDTPLTSEATQLRRAENDRRAIVFLDRICLASAADMSREKNWDEWVECVNLAAEFESKLFTKLRAQRTAGLTDMLREKEAEIKGKAQAEALVFEASGWKRLLTQGLPRALTEYITELQTVTSVLRSRSMHPATHPYRD